MKVNRTQRIIIITNPELDRVCRLTKNLYNYANYCIRRRFIKSGRFISAYTLIKIFVRTNQPDYRALPAQTAQQVLLLLEKNWKSFFRSIKDYKKNPDKYLGRPGLPRYKKKNGKSIAVFTNQQCRIEDGYIRFPKKIDFTVKTTVDNFKQVRIVPQMSCYVVEIVYEKEVIPEEGLDEQAVLGVDLGLNNFATVVNNIGEKPFVINGKTVKSYNQFYNKRKAHLQSIVMQGKEITKGTVIPLTERIKHLLHRRNNKITDFMHKASKFVVDYAVEHKIGTIIIGDFSDSKQGCRLGKRTTQNFVSIPHYKFVRQVEYKAEEVGIKVKLQNEAYTSKCSFLDNEDIKKHESYAGRRISRGLFKTSDDRVINADCNGGYNIIKKVVPNAFAEGIEGVGLHPFRIAYPDKQNLLKLAKVA